VTVALLAKPDLFFLSHLTFKWQTSPDRSHLAHMRLNYFYFLGFLALVTLWSSTFAQPHHDRLQPPAFALLARGVDAAAKIHRPPAGAQRCGTCTLSFATQRGFREHWRAVHAHPIPREQTHVKHHPHLTGKSADMCSSFCRF
jgi:hypothetical protein